MNKRYREVTIQNGKRHVHSVLLAEDEVQESLDAEALLHRMGGWRVPRRARSRCNRCGATRSTAARAAACFRIRKQD